MTKITREENCLYLTEFIRDYGIYDKAKAIVNFCDKETKQFEKEIDRAILEIFERNGINVPNTDKSVLKLAFDLLKAKGKSIDIVDLYKNMVGGFVIKQTKNHFNVYYDGITIECGVEVKEIEL